ncbi:unnamed protein product [Brassica oleracea var. botrytis]|uniref:BnaC08g47870D protein n=2 Tax=Brassica TaxID=3705 RepID=A0A078IPZ9_BRANA|nr:BnaC08g47870D [Brassica napus]VDD55174.1 unnamed protein product [Brassica oleracea]
MPHQTLIVLKSWRGPKDPSSGKFTYGVEHDMCSWYNKCGANGLCSRDTSPNGKCIEWFEARDKEAWDLNDYTGGCVRKTSLSCSGDGPITR